MLPHLHPLIGGIAYSKGVGDIVVAPLALGYPVQAIVQASRLDEPTAASWRDRAGKQCQRVHEAMIELSVLALIHLQADEIGVSTRLWLGVVVSRTREGKRADRLPRQVRARSQTACALQVWSGLHIGAMIKQTGSTYNSCCSHQRLSKRAAGKAYSQIRQVSARVSTCT